MLGSSEWRMPLNVLILEFFSLYFHFSSFLRGKIDTNKRLCLVFRNVLTFRVEEDFLWYKNACRLLCTCGMLTSSFTHFSLRWVQIIIRIIINPFTNQQRTTLIWSTGVFSVFENNFGTFFQDFLYLFTIISCYFVLHVRQLCETFWTEGKSMKRGI